jgi:hypothetical protein
MSNFICEECKTVCRDTPIGYVTGCEHHPADKLAVEYYIQLYMSTHVSCLTSKSEEFRDEWYVGQCLYGERRIR